MKSREFILLFLLVFTTRFGYFLRARPYRAEANGAYGTMYEMEASADRIAREGRMGDIFEDGGGPSAHVAPLYAFYLAGLDRLAGFNVGWFRFYSGMGSILATSFFIALLPALASRARLSPGVGLAAGLLLTFSPLGLWLEIRGDWETAFLPIALAALFWSLMAMQDRVWADNRLAAMTGIGFGLGGLLSPVVLLAGLAGLFGQVVDRLARTSRIFVAGAIILATCGLTIAPWVYRNYLCFSAFVPVRDNFGIELAVGNNPRADGNTFGAGMSVHPLSNKAEMARLRSMGEVAYNKSKLLEAKDWIAANPSAFVRLSAARLVKFWFPDDWGDPGRLPIPLNLAKSVSIGSITLLAFAGLGWLFATGHPYRALFLAMLVAPSLPYLITHVSYRYRYPINGFVCLLGCECVARLISWPRGPVNTLAP